MNLVINNKPVSFETIDNKVFISSTQIAEVFEKQHKNVLQAIENLPNNEFHRLNFQPSSEVRKNGVFDKDTKCYKITRNGFTLLVMGFTGEKAYHWKVKFIEAFNLMEQTLKNQAPTNMREALLLALHQQDKITELENQIKANEPKVFFADRVQASGTSVSISIFVKTLKLNPNKVFQWLRDEKYLFKRGKFNIPHQKYIDNGYFELTPDVIIIPGGTMEVFTPKITAKGQMALSAKICQAFEK
ncbi:MULTISPECIES: Rha family transcriptional regulator [unclassified Campylobacter]|uniref:Rha family transcriptional regulator n=1 Tax=unclassified Campylobacter TaxID=2593542 RepID=UPI003D33748D